MNDRSLDCSFSAAVQGSNSLKGRTFIFKFRNRKMTCNGLLFLFWAFTFLCLSAAVALPDRAGMWSGLVRICTKPLHTLINFFDPSYGGYAGAFLNTGLVALLCTLIYSLSGAPINDGSVVAFFLTVGLTARGITVLNFLLGIPGVLLYCLVQKKRPGTQANAMVFTSGVSLLFTELLFYYPGDIWHGPTVGGWVLALAVGCIAGYLVAILFSWNIRWDNLLSLYTAALPLGILSIVLNAVLYQLPGVPRPMAPVLTNVGSNWLVSNSFLIIVFLFCILAGITFLGGSFQGYCRMMKDRRWNIDYSAIYGSGNIAINLGCLGLISVIYYNIIGASWTAVTFGSVLCMICTCCRGSNPSNVWPVLLGYLAANALACFLPGFAGRELGLSASAPGLVTGASFVVGLAPIVSCYGWKAGMIAGMMHYFMVTNVLPVIGTFCMYHGGFTAALVCFLLVPAFNCVNRTLNVH